MSDSDQKLAVTGRQTKGSWFGRIAFGLVGILLVALKLIDFGDANDWVFLDDLKFDGEPIHWVLWRGVGIIVLESMAAAAVISIALTYIIVTNTFNSTTIEASEELEKSIIEIRSKVTDFATQLDARQADPEHLRLLKDFLAYAQNQDNAQLRERLRLDDELFNKLVAVMQEAVNARRAPQG